MKKLTIQFAGYGLQDESAINGFQTSAELLDIVAMNGESITGEPLFDYETGTMWKIVNETEKDKQIAELELKIEQKDQQISHLINVVGHNYREQIVKLQKQLESNTKQVCEKIRKYARVSQYWDSMSLRNIINLIVSAELLDQIERGAK